ncbi:MAG: hypothetical protein Q9217_001895 [Psora testacea]
MAAQELKRRRIDFTSPSASRPRTSSQSSTSTVPDANFHNGDDDEQPQFTDKTRNPRVFTYNTTGAFQGNANTTGLFSFKVEELLAQVRPDYEKRMNKVEQALRKLKRIIESIPYQDAASMFDIEQKQLLGQKIRIPFPEPRPKNVNYKFSYSKPSNINVVGSYARKTAIRVGDQLVVDLVVTMPRGIVQERDYLNYRYFHKRAYYLASIAKGIDEDQTCHFFLEYSYQNDSPLQPTILVNPSSDGGEDDFRSSKCKIRILLAADASIFSLAKTMPDSNCVRPRGDEVMPLEPSSFYNATVRSECSSLAYLKLLYSASVKTPAFSDACILGSVWLRQRGFGTGLASGGFGPFEWACTMALLMQFDERNGRSVLSNGHSSYQMFKATLQYLSTTDLVQKPAVVKSDHNYFTKSNEPTLFDGARGLNILFKMTIWSYNALRQEANTTLKLLGDKLVDRFDACFIRRNDNPIMKYDFLLKLPIGKMRKQSPSTADAADGVTRLCQQIYFVLHRGLNDRASLIDLKRPQTMPWAIGDLAAHFASTGDILVGLLLNAENVNRIVDKGPSAEEKEAAADFRMFWGEKTELRRFKDGSILESLTWTSSDAKQSLLYQILSHVIRRHLGDEAAKHLEIISEKFDGLDPDQNAAESSKTLTLYQPLLTAFDALQRQIQSLEGLPLQIRQISAADPSLRYTSSRAPILDPAHSQSHLCNICVQFEGSNRWPDDFAAVQTTKIAFLLKMGELLENSMPGTKTRLGIENALPKYANVAFLDLVQPSGASFRLRIHHEREQFLLERELKSTTRSPADRGAVASALAAYKRNFIQAPLHTQAMRTLSTRFPLLSPSVRLMRRWRDCHLLSHHISDELIELLTLRTFVHPGPYTVPASTMTGFLRTILSLSEWDWRAYPFIADISGEMSAQDIDAINTRFQAWRRIDPAMGRIAMLCASNIDKDGITWTDSDPSKMVAARFTSLAKAAAALVNDQGLDLHVEALFVPCLKDYDFLIHLDRKVCSGGQRFGRKNIAFKHVHIKNKGNNTSLVEFDPVQSFLDELVDLYGSNVVFFHNADGGNIIGGLWNPQTGPRSWKVNVGFSTIPKKSGGNDDHKTIQINKIGTLNDIARLGGDMVRSIERKC